MVNKLKENGYEARKKNQRSIHRCQNLSWKVHDRAKAFFLRSYTGHELRTEVNNYCVFFTVKAKNFVGGVS